MKLNLNTKINLTTNSTTALAGWGEIKGLPVPGCGGQTTLYNEKLGVWNLKLTPKATVDMYSTSYFSNNNSGEASTYAIKPSICPVEWTTQFYVKLQQPEIVINPVLSSYCTIQNIHYDILFTSNVEGLDLPRQAYGLFNGIQLYTNRYSELFYLTLNNPWIELNGYNSNSSFNTAWDDELELLNENLYCRVTFELKNNTNSDVYCFSRYFKVSAYKGSHSHRDINQ